VGYIKNDLVIKMGNVLNILGDVVLEDNQLKIKHPLAFILSKENYFNELDN